jgi:hypothetical protein
VPLTSVLDLLGLLLLVAAGTAAASVVGVWAALTVAGGGVLAVSWLVDRRTKR